jgi:hypothetical protein
MRRVGMHAMDDCETVREWRGGIEMSRYPVAGSGEVSS